jgi:hypothetical protein
MVLITYFLLWSPPICWAGEAEVGVDICVECVTPAGLSSKLLETAAPWREPPTASIFP